MSLMPAEIGAKWVAQLPPILDSGTCSPFAHENRNIGFGHLTTGERKHDFREFLFGRSELVAIQLQKDKAGHGADTLVAVQKGMVPDDVKELGCRHFENIGVKKLSVKGRLRHGNGRLQQIKVTQTG